MNEINKTISKLIPIFCRKFDIHTHRINRGYCYWFAYCLYKMLGGQLCSYESSKRKNAAFCHAFFKLNGRYYDSHSPVKNKNGTKIWHHLFHYDQRKKVKAIEKRKKISTVVEEISEDIFFKTWDMAGYEFKICDQIIKSYSEGQIKLDSFLLTHRLHVPTIKPSVNL